MKNWLNATEQDPWRITFFLPYWFLNSFRNSLHDNKIFRFNDRTDAGWASIKANFPKISKVNDQEFSHRKNNKKKLRSLSRRSTIGHELILVFLYPVEFYVISYFISISWTLKMLHSLMPWSTRASSISYSTNPFHLFFFATIKCPEKINF